MKLPLQGDHIMVSFPKQLLISEKRYIMKKHIIIAALALLALLAAAALLLQAEPEGCGLPTDPPVAQTTTEPEAPPETTVPETTEETEPEETTLPTEPPVPATELALTATDSYGKVWYRVTDNDYRSYLPRRAGDSLLIAPTDPDALIGTLYLSWEKVPGTYELCWDGGTMTCGTNGFLHEAIILPEPVSKVWFEFHEEVTLGDARGFTEGTLPDDVQCWSVADDSCDILAMPTHADDEILFFGPLLAYYIHERGLDVQVAYMTHHWDEMPRPHEMLNALWALGVREYPVISQWKDQKPWDLESAKTIFGEEAVVAWQVEQIRRFEPSIIIAHDVNGEYGHYAHILNTYCLQQAVELAADPDSHPESAALYGAWDTPKMYIHLYGEEPIVFPVYEPMSDGRTPYEVASLAFYCHRSQLKFYPQILCEEDPRYDARLFGLYRSTVGPDTGWDIMENLP